MNACLCKRSPKSPSRCRDPQVAGEDGELRCGTTVALTVVLEDSDPDHGGDPFDAPAIVKAMRAAGWRVDPPTKRRA